MLMSKRRSKVAFVTLIVCVCGFLLLCWQSNNENKSKEISALEYVLRGESAVLGAGLETEARDLLSLLDGIPGLKRLGVSQDSNTLGYESNLKAKQVSSMIAAALQAGGWLLDDTSQPGLLSLQKNNRESGKRSYLLIQCGDVSGGTSVVARLW